MIKFACAACGKRFKVEDVWAGRRSNCPKCSASIEVPDRRDSMPEIPSVSPSVAPSLLAIKTRDDDKAYAMPVAPPVWSSTTIDYSKCSVVQFPCSCGHIFTVMENNEGVRLPCPKCGLIKEVPDHRNAGKTDEDGKRPFWKDPIFAAGGAVSVLILAACFTYLAGRKVPRLRIEEKKPFLGRQFRLQRQRPPHCLSTPSSLRMPGL